MEAFKKTYRKTYYEAMNEVLPKAFMGTKGRDAFMHGKVDKDGMCMFYVRVADGKGVRYYRARRNHELKLKDLKEQIIALK